MTKTSLGTDLRVRGQQFQLTLNGFAKMICRVRVHFAQSLNSFRVVCEEARALMKILRHALF